jgi:hypothetical protein
VAFREALDPGQPGGSPIALPPNPKLVADLTAPTFEVTPNGIKAEPKDKVMERLGRSTNDGDAVVMAWYEGPRLLTDAMDWMDARRGRGGRHGCGATVGRRVQCRSQLANVTSIIEHALAGWAAPPRPLAAPSSAHWAAWRLRPPVC